MNGEGGVGARKVILGGRFTPTQQMDLARKSRRAQHRSEVIWESDTRMDGEWGEGNLGGHSTEPDSAPLSLATSAPDPCSPTPPRCYLERLIGGPSPPTPPAQVPSE